MLIFIRLTSLQVFQSTIAPLSLISRCNFRKALSARPESVLLFPTKLWPQALKSFLIWFYISQLFQKQIANRVQTTMKLAKYSWFFGRLLINSKLLSEDIVLSHQSHIESGVTFQRAQHSVTICCWMPQPQGQNSFSVSCLLLHSLDWPLSCHHCCLVCCLKEQ